MNPEAATIEALLLDLASRDQLVRGRAARQLVNRKEDGACTWPQLLALLEDPCDLVRVQIARAAVFLNAPLDQAILALQALLEDEAAIVSLYARWALEELGQGPYYSSLPRRVVQNSPSPKAGKSDA